MSPMYDDTAYDRYVDWRLEKLEREARDRMATIRFLETAFNDSGEGAEPNPDSPSFPSPPPCDHTHTRRLIVESCACGLEMSRYWSS